MYLHQISGGDEVTRMVVEEVRRNAPLLDVIQFFVEPGGAASLRKDADINTAAAFRAIGSDYGTNDVAPVYAAFALKIFGKTLRVDRAFEDRGSDIPSEFKRQLKAFARTLGKNLQTYLLTGDHTVSALQFDGMKKAIAGLNATQTLTNLGDNGLQIVAGTDNTAKKSHQQFIEALNDLIAAIDGGASALVFNSKIWSRLSTVARDNVSTTTDEFGRQIDHFNGVPIIPAGFKYDGSDNLPLTETKGTSSDTTTIYALRSEEAAYWSLMTTRSGLKVYDMKLVGNFYEQTIELQADSGEAFNGRALACLPGVRLG
ncbi:MAG: hypothetical protein HKK66_03280 [Chlorobiaceae bacterium]|nr:hypothetical protein [Chlorobiaceae bacterium]